MTALVYFRNWHKLPVKDGIGEDSLPSFWIPHWSVALGCVQWTHTSWTVQFRVVVPQVRSGGLQILLSCWFIPLIDVLYKRAYLQYKYSWAVSIDRKNVIKSFISVLHRKKYQGICPPVRRTEEYFDPGAKYHIPGNTPYIRWDYDLVLLQWRFYSYLQKIILKWKHGVWNQA